MKILKFYFYLISALAKKYDHFGKVGDSYYIWADLSVAELYTIVCFFGWTITNDRI